MSNTSNHKYSAEQNYSSVESSTPIGITQESLRAGAGETHLEFPIRALPPKLRAIVEEAALHTRTPHAMSASVALGVVSASIGRGLMVRSGSSRTTPGNLYLLAIARSGIGKGQTFSHISTPLYNAQREAIEGWNRSKMPAIEANCEVLKAKVQKKKRKAVNTEDEDLSKEIAKAMAALEQELKQEEAQKQSCPCYVVADITREALAVYLSSQPNEALACFSPEARGVLSVIRGRYGNGESSDEDIYLSAYSGEPVSVHRTSRPPVSLSNPCLTVVWMAQPDAARSLLSDERMTASGLLPRFLFFDAKAEHEYEPEEWPEINEEVNEDWEFLIRDLLGYRESHSPPIVIDSEEGARRVLREFKNEGIDRVRAGGDLRDIESYVARWAENAWRLALVLHCCKYGNNSHQQSLEEATASESVELMRWFIQEQLAVLAVSRADRFQARLDRLLGLLRDAGGFKTLGQLKDANGFEADEVRSLADMFPERLTVEKLSQPGRPSYIAKIAGQPNR